MLSLERETIAAAFDALDKSVRKNQRAAIQLADILKQFDAGYAVLVVPVGPNTVHGLQSTIEHQHRRKD